MIIPQFFLDANVILYGYFAPSSNCGLIMDYIEESGLKPVINEVIIDEVIRNLEDYGCLRKDCQRTKIEKLLHKFDVKYNPQYQSEINNCIGQIHNSDVPHLATIRKFSIPIIVTTNGNHFNGLANHYYPPIFVKEILKERVREQVTLIINGEPTYIP